MNTALAIASPKQEFAGKRILVTGATGSFGRATVAQLADAGAELTLCARNAEKLEELAKSLPGKHKIAAFDFTTSDSVPDWLRGLTEDDGPFSGIAHLAGVCIMRPLKILNSDLIDQTLNINVVSAIMLGKAFRQKICHTAGASFVLVSSTSSFKAGGGNIAYAASKGAVTAATKAMAHELLRDKIRVNCIVPALVESDMASRMEHSMPTEIWQTIKNTHPLGMGSCTDIAYAVEYFLSGKSRWSTGTALVMDGGLSIV